MSEELQRFLLFEHIDWTRCGAKIHRNGCVTGRHQHPAIRTGRRRDSRNLTASPDIVQDEKAAVFLQGRSRLGDGCRKVNRGRSR